MASFVESATLVVTDKSSGNIRKINAELNKLFKTVNALKGTKRLIDLAGLNKASSGISKLSRELKKLDGSVGSGSSSGINRLNRSLRETDRILASIQTRRIVINVNTTQLTRAQQQLRTLQAQASRPINQRLGTSGSFGGGAGGSGGGFGANAFGPGYWRNAGSQMGFGFRASLGNAMFRALESGARVGGRGILSLDDERFKIRQTLGDTPEGRQMFAQVDTFAKLLSEGSAELVAAGTITQDQANALKVLSQADVLAASGDAVANANNFDDASVAMIRASENAVRMTSYFQDAEEGARQARLAEKALDIRGLSLAEQSPEAGRFLEAGNRAIMLGGGDLSWADGVRMLQQMGIGKTLLTPEGFAKALALRDSDGRQGTADIRSFEQAFLRQNKTDEDVARMRAAGFIDDKGNTVGFDRLMADPIQFAIDEAGKRLRNVFTDQQLADDAFSEAIVKEISRWGLTTTEARIVQGAFLQRDEIANEARKRAAVDPNLAIRESAESLRLVMQKVESQFQNAVTSQTSGFMPLLKSSSDRLAGLLAGVSEGDSLDPVTAIKMGLAAIPLGIGAALAGNGTQSLLLAGVGLNTAAGALSSAALALTGAAGVGAAGGVGGAGASGFLKKLLNTGGRMAGGAAILEAISMYLEDDFSQRRVAEGAAGVGGALAGGTVGSLFGPLGTVIGAAAGSYFARDFGPKALDGWQSMQAEQNGTWKQFNELARRAARGEGDRQSSLRFEDVPELQGLNLDQTTAAVKYFTNELADYRSRLLDEFKKTGALFPSDKAKEFMTEIATLDQMRLAGLDKLQAFLKAIDTNAVIGGIEPATTNATRKAAKQVADAIKPDAKRDMGYLDPRKELTTPEEVKAFQKKVGAFPDGVVGDIVAKLFAEVKAKAVEGAGRTKDDAAIDLAQDGTAKVISGFDQLATSSSALAGTFDAIAAPKFDRLKSPASRIADRIDTAHSPAAPDFAAALASASRTKDDVELTTAVNNLGAQFRSFVAQEARPNPLDAAGQRQPFMMTPTLQQQLDSASRTKDDISGELGTAALSAAFTNFSATFPLTIESAVSGFEMAGAVVGQTIGVAASTGAAAMQQGIVGGASQGAAMFASAIANAAANIRVNVVQPKSTNVGLEEPMN